MRQLYERGPVQVPIDQAPRLRDTLITSGAADVEGLPEELRTVIVETPPACTSTWTPISTTDGTCEPSSRFRMTAAPHCPQIAPAGADERPAGNGSP